MIFEYMLKLQLGSCPRRIGLLFSSWMRSENWFICRRAAFVVSIASTSLGMLAAATEQKQIEVPLPGGDSIRFQAVFLGLDGKEMLTAKGVELGSYSDDRLREPRDTVTLSGSFVEQRPGGHEDDWCYYLGTTEVTEAQWVAVMGGAGAGSDMPKTNVSLADIALFFEKLNSKLLSDANAMAALPKYLQQPAFCRLPTEAEWEFAARGGMVTEPDENRYRADHPYPSAELNAFEYSSVNSRRKVQPCGKLKANPLGLHDMLGNVAEITGSYYGFEFGHGRIGGLTVRGGSIDSRPDELRSSLRREYVPSYNDKTPPLLGQPTKDEHTGFRIALGTGIFAIGAGENELQPAWDAYKRKRPRGTLERSQQLVDEDVIEAEKQVLNGEIDRLKIALQVEIEKGKKNPEPDSANRTLIQLRADLELEKSINSRLEDRNGSLEETNAGLLSENADSERRRIKLLVLMGQHRAYQAYRMDRGRKMIPSKASAYEGHWRENMLSYRNVLVELMNGNLAMMESAMNDQRRRYKNSKSVQNLAAHNAFEKHIEIYVEEQQTLPSDKNLRNLFQLIEQLVDGTQ